MDFFSSVGVAKFVRQGLPRKFKSCPRNYVLMRSRYLVIRGHPPTSDQALAGTNHGAEAVCSSWPGPEGIVAVLYP